ncbi:MAG TPA: heterodisulfide reductase-related iron-sulfur binding cluster [Pyrinomonadaceae bacterium]|nr:heterodisulfide reductase-related iron-sulfur binding cluster [Pyrinomonadaceae bacterium]
MGEAKAGETATTTVGRGGADALAAERAKLLACVHCGLCLEACPTYVHTGDENDGPRGRLYLMRAVEEGRLAADSDSFSRHIARCLGCRACESACPAGVPYGQLLEAARHDIAAAGRGRGWTSRALRLALRHVWSSPRRLAFAFRVARLARDAGLPRLALKGRLSRLLPGRARFALALLEGSRPARLSGATGVGRNDGAKDEAEAGMAGRPDGAKDAAVAGAAGVAGRVLLFEGCVTEGLFARVNRATRRVLEANGYEVESPAEQVCCGALHAHAGDLEGARGLARRNLAAFSRGGGGAAVVTNAGGCGAMLASYAHLLEGEPGLAERAREFAASVRDVSQQLAQAGPREGAALGEVSATYDASCHLLHGQGARVEPLRLMSVVRGLRLVPLEGADVCCGGAGVYNLLEPDLSARVLEEKMQRVGETGAALVATGNPGCHMQLAAGARLRGMKVEVCHPVELLDESYRRAGLYGGEEAG